MSTSRKNNHLLPRTIIFVQTKQGMEYFSKDYAPQRWIKSIKKDGGFTYTRDPRMARRFKTNAQAVALCEKYAENLIFELKVDELRWTDPSDDVGFTYFGYFNGKDGLNYDLYDSSPVKAPASYWKMVAVMGYPS